jgi:hypothetical protein
MRRGGSGWLEELGFYVLQNRTKNGDVEIVLL